MDSSALFNNVMGRSRVFLLLKVFCLKRGVGASAQKYDCQANFAEGEVDSSALFNNVMGRSRVFLLLKVFCLKRGVGASAQKLGADDIWKGGGIFGDFAYKLPTSS